MIQMDANRAKQLHLLITDTEYNLSKLLGRNVRLIITEPIHQELDTRLITDIVCHAFSIKEEELRSKSRERKFTEARYIVFNLIKKHFPTTSGVAIARMFNKDHATVIHASKMYENLYKNDRTFKLMALRIEALLNDLIHPKNKVMESPQSNNEQTMLLLEKKKIREQEITQWLVEHPDSTERGNMWSDREIVRDEIRRLETDLRDAGLI